VRVALRHAAALAASREEEHLQVGDLSIDVSAHLAVAGGAVLELSPRQFRMLVALVRNEGRILTHQQLGQVAAGDVDPNPSDGVRGAMSHLRKRLGTGALRPTIVTEPHVGYRLVAPSTAAGQGELS